MWIGACWDMLGTIPGISQLFKWNAECRRQKQNAGQNPLFLTLQSWLFLEQPMIGIPWISDEDARDGMENPMSHESHVSRYIFCGVGWWLSCYQTLIAVTVKHCNRQCRFWGDPSNGGSQTPRRSIAQRSSLEWFGATPILGNLHLLKGSCVGHTRARGMAVSK